MTSEEAESSRPGGIFISLHEIYTRSVKVEKFSTLGVAIQFRGEESWKSFISFRARLRFAINLHPPIDRVYIEINDGTLARKITNRDFRSFSSRRVSRVLLLLFRSPNFELVESSRSSRLTNAKKDTWCQLQVICKPVVSLQSRSTRESPRLSIFLFVQENTNWDEIRRALISIRFFPPFFTFN